MSRSTREYSALKNPFRVAICVPCQTECKALFAYDLARLMGYCGVALVPQVITHLHLFFAEGTLIAPQRVDLVKRAIAADCTHILWLDSDMRFPKDTLERLLARHRPIIGANYASRRPPHFPTTFKTITEGPNCEAVQLFTHPGDKGLEHVAAAGFGVMLTATDVFKKVEQPWFAVGYSPENEGYEGEDVFFGLRARKAGFEVWCDHDLTKDVRHVGTMEYTMDHSLAVQEMEANGNDN